MRSAFEAERIFVILDFFQATLTFINKAWVKTIDIVFSYHKPNFQE